MIFVLSFCWQHGAQYIYDTDDDITLLDGLRGFQIDAAVSRGLMPATDNLTFNPYPHFGQESLWPRGYPLEELEHNTAHDYQLCSVPQASIRQGLANGEPDVDAILRLTLRRHRDVGKVMFDAVAPRIVIPSGTFVPFNSRNTVFARDALWALILPVTPSDSVCDIYRSYWAQALLWLVDGHLGFYPPNVMRIRNARSVLKDLSHETRIYQDMGQLVKFLHNWKCNPQLSLFGCMITLAKDMVLNKFWLKRDADVIRAWVVDLTVLGYAPPALRQTTVCSQGLPVQYFPQEQNTSFAHVASMSSIEADRVHKDARLVVMQRVCSADIYRNKTTDPLPSTLNVLLVVTVQDPTATIPLIDAYYKRCYPRIIYCGASMSGNMFLSKRKVSYVNISNTVDAVSCTKAASDIGYNVDGVMHVSDRTMLLSGKKLHTHGRDHILVSQNTYAMSNLCKMKYPINCFVLTEAVIKEVSAELDTLKIADGVNVILKHYLRNLLSNSRNRQDAYFVEDVVFYVPEKYMQLFRALADLNLGIYSHVVVLLLEQIDSQPLYRGSDFIFPFFFSDLDTDNAVQKVYCSSMQLC